MRAPLWISARTAEWCRGALAASQSAIRAGDTLHATGTTGETADETYSDESNGNPPNAQGIHQTIDVPPGDCALVELPFAEPGTCPFVTHTFSDERWTDPVCISNWPTRWKRREKPCAGRGRPGATSPNAA